MLAEIVNGALALSSWGSVVQECWQQIPEHFPNVDLDCFIVMPNHIHGIIVIHYSDVGATHASPLQKPGPVKQSLGAIIGSFKSACTKRINESRNTAGLPVWQRNYHERIIRNEDELHSLRDYILTNPVRWDGE